MFAGLSLFYQDVVIGRPGARCDALEAQNMIVCIPGARRCYQRTRLVNLGCKIYVHNLRGCAKMGEMLRTYDCLLCSSHVTLPTSHKTHRASHLERRTHCLTLTASHSPPHTHCLERHTHCLTLTASHLERLTLPTSSASHYPLRASARRNSTRLTLSASSVGPSQQTIALANMPFSPVPKARGPGPLGRWGPCK